MRCCKENGGTFSMRENKISELFAILQKDVHAVVRKRELCLELARTKYQYDIQL